MNRRLAVLLVGLKVLIIVFSFKNPENPARARPDEVFRLLTRVNNDERLIGEVAINLNAGRGYLTSLEQYSASRGIARPTAFRPTYAVWIHVVCQRVFSAVLPDVEIVADQSNLYFKTYAVLLYLASLPFLWWSLFAFHGLASGLGLDARNATLATVLYWAIPSHLYYLGTGPYYENIAMPCLVIGLLAWVRELQSTGGPANRATAVATLVLSCLLRPQTLIVWGAIHLFWLATSLRRAPSRRPYLGTLLLSVVVLGACHAPVLLKNYRLFGAPFLSTQPYFEFYQGHNPLARGGWIRPGTPEGQAQTRLLLTERPDLAGMNEYQEGVLRFKSALSWIRAQPRQELSLTVKKLALFWLPDNYLHASEINGAFFVNALAFVAFALAVPQLLRRFCVGALAPIETGSLGAILGTLALSVVFFAGQRWRYYAEPFIWLLATRWILDLTRAGARAPRPA